MPTLPSDIQRELLDLSKRFIVEDAEEDRYSDPQRTTRHEDTLQEHGYEVLGSGVGRIAVTHPDLEGTVVKVAIGSDIHREGFSATGTAQNQQEHRAWNNLPKSIRHRFNPVHSVSNCYRILHAPRVETDPDTIPYDEAEDFVTETFRELRSHDWNAIELTVNEVGRNTDGDLLFYDYGLPVAPIEHILEEGDVLPIDYVKPDDI